MFRLPSPSSLVTLALLTLPLAGCPKQGSETAGTGPDAWVIFDVVEAGTGNPLLATVWPEGLPDAFDTIVQGEAGQVRFDGIGKQAQGYALDFAPGEQVTLLLWSPGHELERRQEKLKKGENRLVVELRRAEVEDARVPERIKLEVLQSLPSEGPRSGS
jgi:hypothetical protein